MTYRDNMSEGALAAWDRLSQKYDSLSVNSAYRDPAHNAKVGGAKKSQHMHGNAFDVSTAGMDRDQVLQLIQDARGAGFQGIGVYNNALHFDVGGDRAWGSDYTRNSLPGWAAEAVGAPVNALAPQPGTQVAQAGNGPPAAPDAAQQPRNALQTTYLDPADFMTPLPAYQLRGFT